MKTALISIAAFLTLLITGVVAQEATPAPSAVSTNAEAAKPSAADLEARFKTLLTKATLAGRWCLIENGTLGAEKEDKYTILSVSKLAGDAWIINARIQYNKKDMVAPVPVVVKWAGDTPVLILDKIPMPGGGVFSARVLFHEKTYAGTWSGGDHAGLLSGVIKHEAGEKPASQ